MNLRPTRLSICRLGGDAGFAVGLLAWAVATGAVANDSAPAAGPAATTAAPSTTPTTAPAPARGGPPLWEIGIGGAGAWQQAYPGSDERVRGGIVLPWVVYRGPLLRVEGGTAGLRAVKSENFELDIGLAGAFGAGGSGLVARRGMPRLGTLAEAGPRARWRLGPAPMGGRWRADLPVRAVLDVNRGLEYRGLALEPEVAWEARSGPWRHSVAASAIVGDRRLADTFYGVAPAYALPGRPAYEAKAGLITWRLAVSLSRDLGRDWYFYSFARADSVAGAANRASPLVRQTTGATVGVGLSYTWMRSAQRAVD